MNTSNIFHKLKPYKNRYFIVFLLFAIWLTFFDTDSLITRVAKIQDIRQLEKQKEYYSQKIEKDKKELSRLKNDIDNLEKYAREQYLMKEADEDIYIFEED